jgi:hypothetical protein
MKKKEKHRIRFIVYDSQNRGIRQPAFEERIFLKIAGFQVSAGHLFHFADM